MSSTQPARSPVLLYYFQLIAFLGAVPFLIIIADLILHPLAPAITAGYEPARRILFGLVVSPLTLVIAGLCIRRVPRNLIGWLLIVFAYGMQAEVMRVDFLPLGIELMLANFLIGNFWFAFLVIPLYFPDGRLYPARLNRWGNLLVTLVMFSSIVLSSIFNPLYTWNSGTSQLSAPNPLFLVEWNYTVVTIPLMVSLIIASIVTLVLRYRGSREQERLQIRWLLFGVIFQFGITLLITWAPERISNWSGAVYALIIPLAIGIALLRYRLYDVDLIIRRTLQYGLLTFLLGLVYFGGVALLQGVFAALTGQQSPLAVVFSTLLIAVLFTPLRRRLQVIIDRRFFRQKYDAEQASLTFAAAARSETEINSLTGQMVKVIEETVQPEMIWVWMKNGNGERR